MSVARLQDMSPAAVAVASVDPCPTQPRTVFDDIELEELTTSIRAVGIVQPLVVRPRPGGRFEIVSGERRWRAAKNAGLTELPVLLRTLDDDEAFCQSVVENVVRSNLTPMDEVRAVCRLATKYGVQDAARRLGKPHSWVSKRKRIAEAPGFIMDFLSTGASTDIEAHFALAQLADRDADVAKEVIENHGDGGQLREDVKAAARALSDGTPMDEARSHANASDLEAGFKIDSRETAAAADDDDSADPDYESAAAGQQDDALEKSWLPSDAPELDAPFDADVAVLVTAAAGRRAGLVALTTSNGTTTYEFTEQARSQLRALLGPPLA